MTAEEKEICVAWVKAHAHKWQVQSRAQWNYKFRGKTLVRYVKGVQMRENEIKLILEYLSSDDCIATLSLYDQSVSADWKPIRAWLELSNESVGNVRVVTLFHGLRTDPNSEADGPYLVEDGCAYKVHLTYYWSQPSVIQVPAGSSGVSYQIASLSRDQETGLYTYALEKRERVQQDIAEYFTAKTVYETRQEEQHIGVKQSQVSTTGKQASVGGGKIIQRKLSKNQDCTTDVANTTITEVGVKGAEKSVRKFLHGIVISSTDKNQSVALDTTGKGLNVGDERKSVKTPGGLYDNSTTNMSLENVGEVATTCGKTIFQHEDSSTENVANKPESEVDSASGGVIHSQTARQTEYGTWDVQTNTTTELPVASANVRTHKSLRGVTQTVFNRNQVKPLETTGLAVGEDRQSEKTPGGLYNNTITIKTSESVGKIAEDCAKTIFQHEHSTTENVADEPNEKEVGDANGGVINSQTARQTEEGTWDIHKMITTELPVKDAIVSVHKTLRGVTKSTVARNQSNALSTDNLQVGEERRSEKTPGGLYNNTITTKENQDIGQIAEDCAKTIFEHTDSTTTNVANKPNETHVEEASNGIVYQKSSRQTDEGSWNVSETKTTELPVEDAEVTIQKTLRGVVRSTTARNQPRPLDETDLKIGDVRRSIKTKGGLYDTTTSSKDSESVGEIGVSCSTTALDHTDSTTTNVSDKPVDTHASSAGGGHIYQKTSRQTEEGTWDVSETHKQEIVVGNMGEEKRVTPHGYYETKKSRSHDSAVNASGVGDSGSSRITEGGLYEKAETTFTFTGGAGDKGSADNALDTTDSTTNISTEQDTSVAQGGDGKIVQKRSHQNEDGTWENTTITTTEKLVKIGEERRITPHGVFTTKKYRDDDLELTEVQDIGDSGSSSITQGGYFVKEETTFEIKPTEDLKEKIKTKGYETETTREVKRESQDVSIDIEKNEKREKATTLNTDGTWNYTEITTTFNKQEGSSESKYATETIKTTHTTYDENINPTVDSENGSTSVSLNDYGTATVSKTEITPIEVDSGWITWDSETKGVRYTYKYHHGLRIFINKKDVPKPDKGSNVSIRVSINRYGLYEGSMSYEDLYDWEESKNSSSGDGGVKTGIVTWYERKINDKGVPVKRLCQGHVVHYHGTGNEDAEASDAVKSIGVVGVHWGKRMYCTKVKYGVWVEDKDAEQANAVTRSK